jgi:DNA-binding NarL/FixJ family response regulator
LIKIVIYEDHLSRRESLQALLSLSDNMECIGSFGDCSNVVKEINDLQPDIVLMDIEMPNVDGIKGVRLIKENFRKVKVIMQTAFDDNEKIFQALQNGAEGYILKSASVNQIIQSIDEVIKGGAFMTPSVAIKVMRHFNQQNQTANNTISTLTPKESEVLIYLASGLSYKMIADKMSISYFTVNSHVKKIYEKLHVHSVAEAVSYAIKNKLVN